MSRGKKEKDSNDFKGKLNDISTDGDKQDKQEGTKKSQMKSKSKSEVEPEDKSMREEKKVEIDVVDTSEEEGKTEASTERIRQAHRPELIEGLSRTSTKSQNETEGEEKPEKKEEKSNIETQVVLTKEEAGELRKKAEECDSLRDKFLRTKADFLNYQKRMRKEHEATAQFAIQELILDLFPEFDNFERAVKLAENSKDLDKFVEGIKLIEDQLFKVLGKYGVKPIETAGKSFDPNLHEAVIEEENNELPHHTIIEELQRGFLLKDRVVRPSKVKVSKRTVDEDESKKESDKLKEDSAES